MFRRQVFARRADRLAGTPSGASYDLAWAALDPPGSVLDVGAGAGAASLPLLARATARTAVDGDAAMLALLAERATAQGVSVRCVLGSWPDAAPQVPAADVVTCHHVLYNVPGLAPFVTALTAHARRLVVTEMTATHPLITFNELWLRFHGLRRPDGPTATDVLRILVAMGLRPGRRRWRRPGGVATRVSRSSPRSPGGGCACRPSGPARWPARSSRPASSAGSRSASDRRDATS